MPIYFVERDYKIELVYLTIRCPECGLNFDITEYSNQSQTICDCECCGHMLEIKIIVCPECNSSAHVIDYITERKRGAYWCNTCEKIINEW